MAATTTLGASRVVAEKSSVATARGTAIAPLRHSDSLAEGAPMTFGKCQWDGCTRHAIKASTGACRTHHALMRDARCEKCHVALASTAELQTRRCRRCATARAA
jgi:hypothetical protein